jgi:hypothetical protein
MQVHLQVLKNQEARETKVFQRKNIENSEEKKEKKNKKNLKRKKKNLLSNMHL